MAIIFAKLRFCDSGHQWKSCKHLF